MKAESGRDDVAPRSAGTPFGLLPDSEKLEVFASAVHQTRMPMILTDPRRDDDPIVFANPAFEELTGYLAEEVIGRNCRFLQGEDTDPASVAGLSRALRAGRPHTVQLLNYKKDGRPFWNQLFVGPVRDRSGKIVYFFGSQHDTTRRMELEQQLSAQSAELEDRVAERMRAVEQALSQKDLLLRELRHRVKNNLQLMTNIVAAQSARSLSTELRRELDSVRGRLEALGAFYQVLPEDGLVTVELGQVLHAIAVNLAELHDPNNAIELVIDMERTLADATVGSSLGLILHELLTNAFTHAFDGRGGRLVVSLRRRDDAVLLTVEDNGNKRRGDDEGLGMPIVQSLVNQLGGELSYRKEQGYDAFIHLPLSILRNREEAA